MTDPLLGRVLRGKYRVERKLGQGGMGVVYAAVHLELARPVALKTLLDVRDAEDVERLRTEALAAASLAHPHIVSVTDFAPPKGDEPAFLVMELLAGRSLDRVLAGRGALSTPTATHVALQMLDAIGAAHKARILHRDIKPANVIVLDGADADRPWIKIVDFGIAKLMDDASRHTATGALIGTPAYMAPEQLRGERATEAADIYAIGVCLYEMLAGTRPFAKTGGELAAEVLRGDAPALPVEPALASVVQRAMHRDAAQRFASCADFAKALREATAPQTHTARAAPRPRWPLFVGATVVTMAVVAILAALVTPRTRAHGEAAPAPVDAASESSIEIPVASATPTASASETPNEEETDKQVPAKRAAGEVLSLCWTASYPIALCDRIWWDCQCRTSEGFAVFDVPDQSQGSYSITTTDTSKNGAGCAGFTHGYAKEGGYAARPVIGTYRCGMGCGRKELLASRRMAVPGTPCSGYANNERMTGTWRKYVP